MGRKDFLMIWNIFLDVSFLTSFVTVYTYFIVKDKREVLSMIFSIFIFYVLFLVFSEKTFLSHVYHVKHYVVETTIFLVISFVYLKFSGMYKEIFITLLYLFVVTLIDFNTTYFTYPFVLCGLTYEMNKASAYEYLSRKNEEEFGN